MRTNEGPRVASLLLVGALVFLAGGRAEGDPRGDGPSCVLDGRVTGLRAEMEARVELRRLGDVRWRRCETWDSERWLARGEGTGPPLEAASVRADDASFAFAGLATGVYALRVVPSGGLTVSGVEVLWADGQHVTAEIALRTGTVTLEARLSTPSGAPFRGVVVAAQQERGRLAYPFLRGAVEVPTDETGKVVVEGLHAGPCELTALVPGELRVRGTSIELPFDGTYEWDVDPGPGLTGTLVAREDETPVRAATVYAFRNGDPSRPFALARAVTDDTGTFRLPVGGKGTEVLVVARGHAPARVESRDETDLGTIRLARLATLTGWVRGPDGAPRAGVVVHAQPRRWPFATDRPGLQTRTDSAGRYLLADVPPGEVGLSARSSDWVTPRAEGVWQGEFDPLAIELRPGEVRRVDLDVTPAARIRGRVLDVGGAPVAGALVTTWVRREPVHVATDAEGRFELGGLAAGKAYDLRVRAPGLVESHVPDVAASATAPPLEVRFEATSFASVSVVTMETHEPVCRARLRVSQPTVTEFETRSRPRGELWTDARGAAQVGPLLAGTTLVAVSAPGFEPAETEFEAGTQADVQVRLVPVRVEPAFHVRGRVLAPEGVELGPVDLRRSEPDEVLLGRWGRDGGSRVAVRPDGSFEALVPAEGRYGLRAQMERGDKLYFAQTSAQAGDVAVELHLRPAPWAHAARRTWTFRVRDQEGRPVAGGTAVADVDVGRKGARRDLRRHYRGGALEVVAESEATDAAWYFRDAVDACGLWLPYGPARVSRVAPGGAPIEVVLPPEQFVHGFVTGPDGRGVRGVRVWARPVGDSSLCDGGHRRHALTRDDGRFRLGGLGEGPYVLRLDVPVRMARVEGLLVEGGLGRHSDVQVRLHEAVAPRVLVQGPDGEPLAGAGLEVQPTEGDLWTFADNVVLETFYSGPGFVNESTDESGWASFTRLDPQQGYVLWVHPPGGRAELAPRYFAAWTPRAVQAIRLEPFVALQGVVVDPAGEPAEGVTVWVRQPGDDEFRGRAETTAGGRFTIERLRPGPVTLVAGDDPHGPVPDTAPGLLHTTTKAKDVVLTAP